MDDVRADRALETVRLVSEAKQTIDLAYLEVIACARSCGATYVQIGRAAGVTRQAVRQLLQGRIERLAGYAG